MATPNELLTQHAKANGLTVIEKPNTRYINEGQNRYGVDNDKQPFTWGLRDTHPWIKLCNENNYQVDIM